MMKPSLMLLLGLALSSVAGAASDRFESPTAGVAFAKPGSWVFASLEPAQESRGKVRLPDAELEQQMKASATPPLAVVTKHPEPWDDLNPTFQLGLRPLGGLEGRSAKEVLAVVLPTLARTYSDFREVSPITDVQVGGLPAARVGIEHTLRTADGGAFPTRNDMIVVPRGKFMFFIGMGRNPDDKDAGADLEAMLSSVEIQP